MANEEVEKYIPVSYEKPTIKESLLRVTVVSIQRKKSGDKERRILSKRR